MKDEKIGQIFHEAAELHESVNQEYGEVIPETGNRLPYSAHLGDVVQLVLEYGKDFPNFEQYKYVLVFAASFHDAIEDARETYNDILKRARKYFNEDDAIMATEIVYALTNEKGRNRSERANEKYYQGIRETPWAPFVKCCDRLANYNYSKFMGTSMAKRYTKEMPEFLNHVIVNDSPEMLGEFDVPARIIEALYDQNPSMFYVKMEKTGDALTVTLSSEDNK